MNLNFRKAIISIYFNERRKILEVNMMFCLKLYSIRDAVFNLKNIVWFSRNDKKSFPILSLSRSEHQINLLRFGFES